MRDKDKEQLIVACKTGDLSLAKRILKNIREFSDIIFGLNRNETYTLLILASQNGYIGIVKQLLKKGANPALKISSSTFPISDGWDALHAAAQNGHSTIVKILLQHNAIPEHTHVGIALEHEKNGPEIVHNLLSHGASVTKITTLLKIKQLCDKVTYEKALQAYYLETIITRDIVEQIPSPSPGTFSLRLSNRELLRIKEDKISYECDRGFASLHKGVYKDVPLYEFFCSESSLKFLKLSCSRLTTLYAKEEVEQGRLIITVVKSIPSKFPKFLEKLIIEAGLVKSLQNHPIPYKVGEFIRIIKDLPITTSPEFVALRNTIVDQQRLIDDLNTLILAKTAEWLFQDPLFKSSGGIIGPARYEELQQTLDKYSVRHIHPINTVEGKKWLDAHSEEYKVILLAHTLAENEEILPRIKALHEAHPLYISPKEEVLIHELYEELQKSEYYPDGVGHAESASSFSMSPAAAAAGKDSRF